MSMFSITSASSTPRRCDTALERVEVHADQVDRLDLVLVERVHVLGFGAHRQQPRVDARVERLHAPVEDLREAGVVLDRRASRCRRPRARAAVPPVETISTPSSASPRAKSTSPRLSDTRQQRAPDAHLARCDRPRCRLARVAIDLARSAPLGGCRGRRAPARRRSAARPAAAGCARSRAPAPRSRRCRAGYGSSKRLLQDDRAAVDALVDEVDGHAGHLHAVLERLLDRAARPGTAAAARDAR